MAENDKKTSEAAARQRATVRYVDNPDCAETFADSVNSVFFDGQTMRIEFGITRMDEMKKDQAADRPPLPGLPPRAGAGRGHRPHQQDAADRRRPCSRPAS